MKGRGTYTQKFEITLSMRFQPPIKLALYSITHFEAYHLHHAVKSNSDTHLNSARPKHCRCCTEIHHGSSGPEGKESAHESGLCYKQALFYLRYIPITINLLLYGAYDDIHPFRPLPYLHEPRFEKSYLTSVVATYSQGKSTQLYTGQGKKTSLTCDKNDTSYSFDVSDLTLHLWQNYEKGLFFHCYIPLREISLTTHSTLPLDPLISPYMRHGLGDIALICGWTKNHEETSSLDFFDITVSAGCVIPSSPVIRPRNMLDFPIGYNGASALFAETTLALGYLNWLTLGAHTQAMGFSSTPPYVTPHGPLKPSPALSGSLYVKADHIICGFSLTIGVSAVWQSGTCKHQEPWCSTTQSIDQFSPRYPSWSQESIQCSVEYDGATLSNPYAPRIGLLYSSTYSGTNSLSIDTIGGLWDMTIQWNF